MAVSITKTIKKRSYRSKVDKNDYMYKSRNYFVLEGITGVAQYSLTAGAFLAGFINLLDGSEQINGMIAVIPAIVGLLQIFSSIIFERLESRKKTIIAMATTMRVLLSAVYFIPMIFIPYGLGLHAFIVCYFIAYSINALNAPALGNWLVDITPLSIRGQYLAYKDKVSLIMTAVLTIVLGEVLDYFKNMGNQFIGFGIVGLITIVLGILNIYALMNIKELKGNYVKKKYKLKEVVTTPINNNSFRKIIILFIIWNFALQIGGPYIAVYMVTKLELKYTYMMSLTVVTMVVRVLVSNIWGRIADKKSWFLSTKISIGILAISHFTWGFVNTNNYLILIPLLHILGGIAWSGINISLFNIQFLFAKKEGRTMYIGLNAAIGGIFSGIAVWIGGKIIGYLDGVKFNVFNININNMQITFFISGILLILCPLFVKLFIEKNEIEQDI
jgi:MFS family permease